MESKMDEIGKRQWDLVILIGLTLLALTTRGYGIAEWHIVHDETYTVMYAADRYLSLVNPAYYLLVLGSFNLFGETEWAARLPAMLLGALSVPVFYITWQSIVGRNVALIGALFIIFSSWHLEYSQFSRFYSGVFLFGSLAYFLYYQAIRLDSLKYLAWAMLASLAGILFHVTSVMVPASCALFSLLILLPKQAAEEGYSRRIAVTHLAICAAAGLLAVSFLWQIAAHRQSRGGVTWGAGPAEMILQITKNVQIPLAVSAFFGMILLLQRDLLKGIFFAIGIAIPMAFVLISSAYLNSRPVYMFYALPLIFVLAAYVGEQARQALMNYRFASYALTIIVIASLMPEMVSHYTGRKSVDIREAVEFVEDAYQPGDQILFSPPEFYYYAGEEYTLAPTLGNPYAKREWREILQPYKDENQRVWIILQRYRKPYAKELEEWLLNNAALVWRKSEERYDYQVKGYEVFLVNGSEPGLSHVSSQGLPQP